MQSIPELSPDDLLLHDRYRLHERLLSRSIEAGRPFELWKGTGATDLDSSEYLIKLWPVEERGRAGLERALWDRELRHQFRVASLPGASRQLLVIRNAGLDDERRRFVMILESSTQATTPLSSHLSNRKTVRWLAKLTDRSNRVFFWQAMDRLAQGLALLHSQQIIHSAIDADAVFADSDCTSESFRLGGFEWSLRISEHRATTPRAGDSLPPVSAESRSFPDDWRRFGLLCRRILLGEHRDDSGLFDDERTLLKRLTETRQAARLVQIDDIRGALRRIIETLSDSALRDPDRYLALFVDVGPNTQLTRAVVQKSKDIRLAAQVQRGANPEDPALPAELSPLESHALRAFIQEDLVGARLTVAQKKDGTTRYTLNGRLLPYDLREDRPTGTPTWASAKVSEVGYQAYGDEHQTELRPPIRVFRASEPVAARVQILAKALPWKPLLPDLDDAPPDLEGAQPFLDFLRFTNQIEVLFRDAEIVPYTRVGEPLLDEANHSEYWILADRDRDRDHALLSFVYRNARASDKQPVTLVGFIADLLMRTEASAIDVYLGTEPDVSLNRKQEEVEAAKWTTVAEADCPEAVQQALRARREGAEWLVVKRIRTQLSAGGTPQRKDPLYPPTAGFLRTLDHRGQTKVIERRREAIEDLREHTYLLDAILTPARRYIDTGLPLPTLPGPSSLDDAKKKALRSAWQTRPLFVLQGPPGTGKTTYVANLLGRIFADDPMAQVLVTAQAHPAVDVLQKSVQKIFADLREPGQPLAGVEEPIAIRAPRPSRQVAPPTGAGALPTKSLDEDSVRPTARRLLADCLRRLELEGPATRSPLQDKWRDMVRGLHARVVSEGLDADAEAFVQLVQRAANLTYCTSNSGELVSIDARDQTFDWSIVEEAGKAHGFELVLPLRLGHRWVLIGDHLQLPPFRHDDFLTAIKDVQAMGEVIDALDGLKGGGLVDRDLISRWNAPLTPAERARDSGDRPDHKQLYETCQAWLKFFKRLYIHAHDATKNLSESQRKDSPPLAQMLDQQHRMHPAIAELVSRAYYEPHGQGLVSMTRTEDKTKPPSEWAFLERVTHPFRSPAGIVNKAIVWLDVPKPTEEQYDGARESNLFGQQLAPAEIRAIERFLQRVEVDPDRWESCFEKDTPSEKKSFKLAVLSPYTKQVVRMRKVLGPLFSEGPRRPPWLRVQETEHKRGAAAYVHTVDSYQGNEADVVFVSLVRNRNLDALKLENRNDPTTVARRALGFLEEEERMNVLVSRAERLLVLVGSWDFFFDATRLLSPEKNQPLHEMRTFIDWLAAEFAKPFAEAAAIQIKTAALISPQEGGAS